MEAKKNYRKTLTIFMTWALLFLACPAFAEYPDKPITIYCGYGPGASTDASSRALASGLEKMWGVPVVVENKPGGGTTVCAGLVASKKPDGYTLGVISEGALTASPLLQKLAYDPLKDFTFLAQYATYFGAFVVRSDAPWKTLDEFIAHAKANPGMSYTSTGMHTRQQISAELLGRCKGLTFRHVPTKGGADASTMLMGGHADFSTGSSQIVYVRQGVFRLLLRVNAEKRDPSFPDVPTLKEIGCPDVPSAGLDVVAPRGLPPAISQKLVEGIRKVTLEPPFQKVLVNFDIPYDFLDQEGLAKKIKDQYEWFKDYLAKTGIKTAK
ncbi:MAG: tripartite tricarboxylate transporter substrate binding protein [Syntrophaceae bacterium]|nr:tripartite tricarboxylate transporter substrate binding protein [Syntrophaceae bacterium]